MTKPPTSSRRLLTAWNLPEGVRQIVLGLLIIVLLLAYAREWRS